MSSSAKRYHILECEPGFFIVSDEIEYTYVARLKDKQHAERLAQLCEDSGCRASNVLDLTPVENKRMAEICKLFCLQENLTWEDLGFDEEAIRNVNMFLEMPLDLHVQ